VRGESRRLRRERDNAKTHFFRCLLRRIAQRDRAVAIMRLVFSATLRTAADAKSVHDHLSRHHAGPTIERARFDIRLNAGMYMPARGRRKSSNRCVWPPFAASPLMPRPDGLVLGHFHGRARSCPRPNPSCLTANSTQPQPRRYHGNQFITEKNMCDDVNANKSLFGNERETPSIRSSRAHGRPPPVISGNASAAGGASERVRSAGVQRGLRARVRAGAESGAGLVWAHGLRATARYPEVRDPRPGSRTIGVAGPVIPPIGLTGPAIPNPGAERRASAPGTVAGLRGTWRGDPGGL
jgi:hypothetical protein